MKRRRLILGFVFISITAFLIGQATPECTVTPEMIVPQGEDSTLDADMLDGLHAAQICDPPRTIVSAYAEYTCPDPCPTEISIMEIPADKEFILTDVSVDHTAYARMTLRENDTAKLAITVHEFYLGSQGAELRDPATRTLHFNSGIPFGPGTNVNIYNWSTAISEVKMTIAGYMIDS